MRLSPSLNMPVMAGQWRGSLDTCQEESSCVLISDNKLLTHNWTNRKAGLVQNFSCSVSTQVSLGQGFLFLSFLGGLKINQCRSYQWKYSFKYHQLLKKQWPLSVLDEMLNSIIATGGYCRPNKGTFSNKSMMQLFIRNWMDLATSSVRFDTRNSCGYNWATGKSIRGIKSIRWCVCRCN